MQLPAGASCVPLVLAGRFYVYEGALMSTYEVRVDESPRFIVTERDRRGVVIQTWTFKSQSAADEFLADIEEADSWPASSREQTP